MSAARETTHTSGSLAAACKAALTGPADLPVTEIAALEKAGETSLTFLRDASYLPRLGASKSRVVLISARVAVPPEIADGRAFLAVPSPDHALVDLIPLFAPVTPKREAGIHPRALVDPAAVIAPSAHIGPHCTIGPGTVVGDGAVLVANVTLGAGVAIGPRCTLYPGVTVYDHCVLVSDVTLHAGVVIGGDGFGYLPALDGRSLVKVPHAGSVLIEPHVEVGANSCIDRSKFPGSPTRIGAGTKIDNLVQIAHGCNIGRGVIIYAQCGLAGSVTLGDGVVLAGQSAVGDNFTLGAGAKLAGQAGAGSNIPPGEVWTGSPARPFMEERRAAALVRKMLKDRNPGAK